MAPARGKVRTDPSAARSAGSLIQRANTSAGMLRLTGPALRTGCRRHALISLRWTPERRLTAESVSFSPRAAIWASACSMNTGLSWASRLW